MKFTTALAVVATVALIGNVEAKRPSIWARKRVAEVKNRMERTYGKGLAGLYDDHGKFRVERLGWDNRHTGGARLGSSLSVEIIPGVVIDASGAMAQALGFVKGMQYSGLSESATSMVTQTEQLSNCFASTYAMFQSFDSLGYNINTFSSQAGSIKIFDVAFLDPLHIVGDMTVNWEMCDVAGIIDQFKSMASLDYAAVANNLTRYVMVAAIDMPDMLDQISTLKKAGECATKSMTKQKKAKEDPWAIFQADPESLKGAADCIEGAGVDNWATGQIAGKLFSKIFGQALETNL